MKQVIRSIEQIKLSFLEDAENYKKRVLFKFRIDDFELVNHVGPQGEDVVGYPVWIHSFATHGLEMILLSNEVGGSRIQFAWTNFGINFDTKDNITCISSDFILEEPLYINQDILIKVWKEFGLRVYKAVVNRHPDMSSYAWWEILTGNHDEFINKLLANKYQTDDGDSSWFEEDPQWDYLKFDL